MVKPVVLRVEGGQFGDLAVLVQHGDTGFRHPAEGRFVAHGHIRAADAVLDRIGDPGADTVGR